MPKKGKEPAGLRRWRLAHRRKGKSHRSARSSGESRAPGFAAMYQQGKTAAQVLSPLIPPLTRYADGTFSSLDQVRNDLRVRLTDAPIRSRYARGLFVSLVDAWASRKIRHTQALGQKSITAAAPEIYAVGTALADNDLDLTDTFSSFVETTTGFDPQGTGFSTRGRLRTYLALKYGGKGGRVVAKAVPAFGRPIKKALNMLGLTL